MGKMKKSMLSIVWLTVFSLALGAAWTTKRLSNNDGYSAHPDLAVNGLNVFAVWSDDTTGNAEIYFRKSVDGGATWQAEKLLTNNAGNSCNPSIALKGAELYVVWDDDTSGNNEIYFRKSIDAGASWQASKRLTNTAGFSDTAKIAVNGSNVYVAWNDNTPGTADIYFKRSADGGSTWQATKKITNNAGTSIRPDMACDSSSVYLVWYDNTTGNYEIYFRKSVDNGSTWQTAQQLTNSAGNSDYPHIAVGGSNVYVVWDDETTGNLEIYFRKSTNGGSTWQTEKRLTFNSGQSSNPILARSGVNLYVAWTDGTPGNSEVYFRKSADGGSTWQSSKRLTNNLGYSAAENMAVNSTNVYVICSDNDPGNSEIYLKYSPL